MAWWQKKLLRYALLRTGLLDDKAVDLQNLDITLGRQNVIELKDVGLNIIRISKLAQLPPSLRVETARILLLRLTVPADIYQSSIIAEVDGIELVVKLESVDPEVTAKPKHTERSPVRVRSPQHRKVHRRLHSPPPYDPGGPSGSEEDVRIPNTEELARSFLVDEPIQERRELEASLAADSKSIDESIVSETSESGDVGIGAGIGLPGFLASFLQGIVDRLQVRVKDVEVRVESEIPGESLEVVPITLRLRIGSIDLPAIHSDVDTEDQPPRRNIQLKDLSFDLLSVPSVFTRLSELPSPVSPAISKQPIRGSPPPRHSPASPLTERLGTSLSQVVDGHPVSHEAHEIAASLDTINADRFVDVAGGHVQHSAIPDAQDFDIRPGDDNISWGSRRSKSSAHMEDLWSSMASEDDLPDSLLLEPAVMPKAKPSRNPSPVQSRTRHAVSPYDRGMQGPGSWPRLEESPERQRLQQSPGSWPVYEQTQHSVYQPLSPDPTHNTTESRDNKRTALEASTLNLQAFPSGTPSPRSLTEQDEHSMDDMSQSRLYSHEDAQSMYVSAMTHSPSMQVPGGWGSEGAPSEQSDDQSVGQIDGHDQSRDPDLRQPSLDERPSEDEQQPSANATPRAQSPASGKRSPRPVEFVTKHLLSVDHVSAALPVGEKPDPGDEILKTEQHRPTHARSSSAGHGMPGAFSMYYDASVAQMRDTSTFRDEGRSVLWSPEVKPVGAQSPGIELSLGCVRGEVDLSTCRLLSKVFPVATEALKPRGKSAVAVDKGTQPEDQQAAFTPFSVSMERLDLSLLEDLAPTQFAKQHSSVIGLHCEHVGVGVIPGTTDLRVGRMRLILSGGRLLSFDRESTLSTSTVGADKRPDVKVVFRTDRFTAEQRSINEVIVETLPAKVELDLGAIDDTFGSFGGLGGVLELSNSILSDAGARELSSSPGRPTKGVRFAADASPQKTGPELKVNVIVGGVEVTLQGDACAVILRTSTLRTVYRERMVVATVSRVTLDGPHHGGAEAPIAIDLASLRLEYLIAPEHKDLERLLSLLTPSKDKYDSDDDILIDTLLRQRKKGAVLRAAIGDAKCKVTSLDVQGPLEALGTELGKLSAVTKYLPEDERPGLLSLVRVKKFEAHLPVNVNFGQLQVVCHDFHCAHVGLPALLALSIGALGASRLGHAELVHALINADLADNLPMVMARMLGDEAEPTVKVKLFNVAVEYSVPTLVALTGLHAAADAEDIVAELAKSVTILTDHVSNPLGARESQKSDSSRSTNKRTNVEVLVHDSAIGLTPASLPSKGLLILTDTRLSTVVPPDESFAVSLELRKAAVFITDRLERDSLEGASPGRGSPNNTTTNVRLATALYKQGYVSVGSIMKAEVRAKIDDANDKRSKSVEIDVRNELFLLESCADSTQTLLATLSGLAPPTPPSKQAKYLTEPMTIEDMMASFTGDAFAQPEAQPETLFDAEERPGEDADLLLDAPTMGDDADDLLSESEMTSSLYGPVSGILGGIGDEDAEDVGDGDFAETAESLLEEDPFEMPLSPTDTNLSDTGLMRELGKQCKPAVSNQAIDLGLYEIEDLGFDALASPQQALGNPLRFAAPTVGRKLPAVSRDRKVPFRLRLRDMHVIWNIYDGYDWQRTRDGITVAVEQVESRAEERRTRRRQSLNDPADDESVIGDLLFNSIYIGVPSNHDAQELRRQINRGIDDTGSETESVPLSGMSRPTSHSASGQPRLRQRRRLKLERSKAHKVAFELKGVAADIVVMPPESQDLVSSIDVRVREFEIFDNVPTSTWRKFLTPLNGDQSNREMSKPMAHIELLNMRTLQNYAASEIAMHVSVLPLRLHVDQDALDFITRFFEFKDENEATSSSSDQGDKPFLQRVEVDTVDMRLDYKPKHVDYAGLRSGHTSEFMNFVTLDAANIRLKHAIIYGLHGFEPLHKTLNDIWLPDVKRNQLPVVLAGLAPVRSLVNIGTGVRDVVAIPIREYQKDGRIVRSIQKGAFHFGKTTASELVRLGAKVAIGTQNILRGAEELLAPDSASPSGRPTLGRSVSSGNTWVDAESDNEDHERRAISAYANQPLGVLSGLRTARRQLEHDLLTVKDAFIAVQGEVLDGRGPGAAAAAVARYGPTIILKPLIGASRAVGTTLLGAGNQIDPSNLRRMEDKYKRR